MAKTLILRIIKSSPRATIASKPIPVHPNAIAAAPTCPEAIPYANAFTIATVAPAERCCQKADISARSAANVESPKASCDTGREGNGLTSHSLP